MIYQIDGQELIEQQLYPPFIESIDDSGIESLPTGNTFSFWVEGINISRSHNILLHLNHSDLGYVVQLLVLDPIITEIIDDGDIESQFEAVFGEFPLGFVLTFFIYLPSMCLLILPGLKHPALGIFFGSLYLAWTQIAFQVPLEFYSLIPFIFSLGILLLAYKGGWLKI